MRHLDCTTSRPESECKQTSKVVFSNSYIRHVKTLASKKYGVDLPRFTHRNTTIIYASTKEDDTIRYHSLHDNKYLQYFRGHKKKWVMYYRILSLDMQVSLSGLYHLRSLRWTMVSCPLHWTTQSDFGISAHPNVEVSLIFRRLPLLRMIQQGLFSRSA